MVILMLVKCLQKAQNDYNCKHLPITQELPIRNTLDYGRREKPYNGEPPLMYNQWKKI